MAGGFFKIPNHSVFNYQPVFYDPENERREKKRRQLRMEQGKDPDIDDDASTEDRIRGRMSAYRIKPVKKAKRASNLRLLVIFGVLLLLTYVILAL